MKILLAVSGGIDSMYMLNRAPELFPGALYCVAHCNFHLRGAESDSDRKFVEEWCSERRIRVFAKDFDTSSYARENGISIEMAARELRYEWFADLCRTEGFDAVAVAHNANDNAETLILNILRGTGSRGLRGMSSERIMNGTTILRPLLETSRESISEWMKSKGAQWREDSTNSSSEYKRNLIRNKVFPLFQEINPSFLRTIGEDIGRFRQLDDIAQDYYREAAGKCVLPDGDIDLTELMRFKHWEYLIYRMMEERGISLDRLGSLVQALKSGNPTAGKLFGEVTVASGRLCFDKGEISRELVIETVPKGSLTSLKQPEGTLILDSARLPYPLKIRSWEPGDWMIPLGMKGRKKLSDMFVDLKWSALQKRDAKVVEMEGSHVAALLCERIDDAVRVTDSSEKILKIRFKP